MKENKNYGYLTKNDDNETYYEKWNRLHYQSTTTIYPGNHIIGITFETKNDAKNVLNEMKKLIKKQGYVTLYEFNDLAGFKNYFERNKNYGWKNVDDVSITESTYGWTISLPNIIKVGGC